MLPRFLKKRIAVLPALILTLGPQVANGQSSASSLIEQARTEMAQLNIESGIALYEQAEATGQNQREALLEIYRARAEAHAALGRGGMAEQAFRILLALDPDFQPPKGSSPKVMQPFDGAREFLAKRTLAIECRTGSQGALLVVLSDPVDLVTGARLLDKDGNRLAGTDDGRGSGRIALELPDDGSAPAACSALDRYGNQLMISAVSVAPTVPGSAAQAGKTSIDLGVSSQSDGPSGRPLYARWWLWGGMAAVSAGATVYFGLQVQAAQDDIEALSERSLTEDVYYQEVLDIEDRGKKQATRANVALGATAVLSAVSAGLLIHQLMTKTDDPEQDPGLTGIWASPIPGGGAVGLSHGF